MTKTKIIDLFKAYETAIIELAVAEACNKNKLAKRRAQRRLAKARAELAAEVNAPHTHPMYALRTEGLP